MARLSSLMMCDLCRQDSDRIVRVDGLQVCHWCVSHDVIEKAVDVDVNIAKLREAVVNTVAHIGGVIKEEEVQTELELAYAAYASLSTAMKDLAAITRPSDRRLEISIAATSAIGEYKAIEDSHKRADRHL